MVSGVSSSRRRDALWRSSVALVVRLQAASRGFLLRRRLEARRRYLGNQTPAAVLIQVRDRPAGSFRVESEFMYKTKRKTGSDRGE